MNVHIVLLRWHDSVGGAKHGVRSGFECATGSIAGRRVRERVRGAALGSLLYMRTGRTRDDRD